MFAVILSAPSCCRSLFMVTTAFQQPGQRRPRARRSIRRLPRRAPTRAQSTRSTRCRSTERPANLIARREGPRIQRVRRSGRPERRRRSSGRGAGGRSSRPGRSRRTSRTSRPSGRSSTSRGCCSTRPRSRSSARSGRSPRPRWSPTASRASGSPAATCCSWSCSPRSSCRSRSRSSRTYVIFTWLGWNGTWLPLIVPHFFANAFNVFLLRQYFMTIPRDLDEAAMIDGAGPFRILRSVILPQSMPAIVGGHPVPLLLRLERLLRAAAVPGQQARAAAAVDRDPAVQRAVRRRSRRSSRRPRCMTMAVPVVVFFLAQRAFMRGVVVTGVDK